MAEITAAAVTALRARTGLPLMKCKAALTAAGGDADKAVEALRKEGEKFTESRGDRELASGRIGVYASISPGIGAMVELLCESAPVTNNDEFIQLVKDLTQQLATGPGAATAEELLAQPSPSKPGEKLSDQLNHLMNRIREVFKVNRLLRVEGPCGGYAHHTGTAGVLLEVKGANADLAKDICMHIAAMKPIALKKEDVDPAFVEKEREILRDAALKEGKPAQFVDKMVEGRLRVFFEERVLNEQKFVKDDSQSVGAVAKKGGLELVKFVSWELGKK